MKPTKRVLVIEFEMESEGEAAEWDADFEEMMEDEESEVWEFVRGWLTEVVEVIGR